MSVQRAEVHWARYLDGNRRVVLEADHARIVAEAGAAVFAFHPEWTVTGMCDPDCLACRRLTELITERSAGYEEGKADAEQAHAAALAEAECPDPSICEREGCVTAAAYRAGGEAAIAEYARYMPRVAAPRTLTADDPEPAVTSVGLDRDQSVWQRVGSTEHSRWVNPFMGTREWSDVLARGPVRLLHDGEATPQVKPCSTCGEPVAYLTARPGWAGGWLHHPARPLDGHPAAIDGEATP